MFLQQNSFLTKNGQKIAKTEEIEVSGRKNQSCRELIGDHFHILIIKFVGKIFRP